MQNFDKFNKIKIFDYPNCDYIKTILKIRLHRAAEC